MNFSGGWSVIGCLVVCLVICVPATADFYVGPTGKDTNPGAREAPFATLERAREAVRAVRKRGGLPAGGVTVWLRQGAYRRTQTFTLTAEDSGAEGKPIVYRAAPGERVRIVGGVTIPPAAFHPVADPVVLKRLDPSARGKVLQADLKALGVTDFGKPLPVKFQGYAGWPELFVDGAPMRLARWPNEGFARIAKVLDRGSRPRWNEKPDRPGVFQYRGDRPERWLTAPEVYLNGYWCFKWYDECLKVAKIDPQDKSITFAAPHVYGVGGPSGGYYFALNLLEELDAPGEYYVDRKTGTLYFLPPAPLRGKEIALSLLEDPLVTMTGASNIIFAGLVFECSRGVGVTMTDGRHNRLLGCTIRNLATNAVYVRGGTDNGVQSCDLYNLGGAGVSLSGGDRATLTHCDNFVDNCHIHDFGRLFRTHHDAVHLSGVGCRVSHCLIHDAPHHALDFGGNEHLIEFNEIHHVCAETDDAGAIYTGRDWTVRGTVIRNNFFHDIGGSLHVGDQAIYVDDTACGVRSVGNVIYRVFRAFLLGGGRDNVIDNNVIVDCKIPVHIDNRGMNWSGKGTENWGTLTTRLNAVPYQKEPWRSRYPELANILEDEPGLPKRNQVTRNLIVRCGKMHVAKEARELGTIENNWETTDDPGFVDAAAMDFSLRDDAPAFKHIVGFQKIPFRKIGLYVDKYRRVLPVSGPSFSPDSAAFVGELEVTLTPAARSPRAEIHYTRDGSDPTLASPRYTHPLHLMETTTVKAAAFATAGGATERSPTVVATYTARKLGPDHGVSLSDLPAVEVFAHGGLKKDVNYSGNGPCVLGGKPFPKSLLLHPEKTAQGGRSQATFVLSGGLQRAKRFTATVGMEAEVGKRGSVTFAVELHRRGKWERVFESKVLKGGDKPESVSVDLAGADQLRLVCTDAGDGIDCDHAVWAAPLLQ